MIYIHFIERLICCLISGLLFIAAFRHLAISNPVKELPATNKYKWIGIVFNSLCVFQLIAFIYFFTQIEYPMTTAEPLIPRDGIVRHSSVHIVWGYATPMQSFAFTFFIGIFACFGFTQYFLRFKPSPSKWWSKILKFIGYVIVWMLYVNSTDFHYFDTSEWIKTGLYLFSLWICFAPSSKPKGKESKEVNIAKEIIVEDAHPSACTEIAQPDKNTPSAIISEIVPEPPIALDDTDKDNSLEGAITTETTFDAADDSIRFCRYCGHQIEADSKFCKYCGKSTGVQANRANGNLAKALKYWNILKDKVYVPKFHFKKSEYNNSKFLVWLKFIAPICLILGIVGIVLCTLYFNHNWNFDGFRCWGVQDKFALFLGFSIAIVVFGLLTWGFLCWHRKSKFNFIKITTFIFATLTYIASLGNIVSTIISICKFDKYYHSIQLDNALINSSNNLHSESVDLFIKGVHNWDTYYLPPEYLKIIRKEAETNIEAQNELGHYYFDIERKEYERQKNQYEYYVEIEQNHERSLYWFKKAADNGHLLAKVNVARFYMGNLPGGYYNLSLAEKYLKDAIYSPEVIRPPMSAYYYLGLIYAEKDYDKARSLWEKGASMGDEDCQRCIESFSIPEDAIHYGYEATDTIAPY